MRNLLDGGGPMSRVPGTRHVHHHRSRNGEHGHGDLSAGSPLDDHIIAALAHDLRNPLASIRLAATSMLSDEIAWDPGTVKTFAQTIDREAGRLGSMLESLLDLRRVRDGVSSH